MCMESGSCSSKIPIPWHWHRDMFDSTLVLKQAFIKLTCFAQVKQAGSAVVVTGMLAL